MTLCETPRFIMYLIILAKFRTYQAWKYAEFSEISHVTLGIITLSKVSHWSLIIRTYVVLHWFPAHYN